VDERHPLALGELGGGAAGLVVAALHLHDLPAVLADRRHLGERGLDRHHRRGLRPQPPRGEREALRVVAGTGRHHTRGALRLGQQGDLVRRPAHLERARELQVLGLQQHRRTDPPRQLAGGQERRVAHQPADAFLRRPDVIERKPLGGGGGVH
jgi:hypothetical protein